MASTTIHDATELIRALGTFAWPVAAIVIALLFRTQISHLLSHGVRRVKAGPFEVEWDLQVSEVETDLEQPGVPAPEQDVAGGPVSEALVRIAEASPTAAVMEAYQRVERELRNILYGHALDTEVLNTGAAGLARLAMRRGVITPETARAVEGLSVLRNLAAHGRAEEVTVKRAREYVTLVDAVLFALHHRPKAENTSAQDT